MQTYCPFYLHKGDTGDSHSNGKIILERYMRNVHERLTLKHGFEDGSVEREKPLQEQEPAQEEMNSQQAHEIR